MFLNLGSASTSAFRSDQFRRHQRHPVKPKDFFWINFFSGFRRSRRGEKTKTSCRSSRLPHLCRKRWPPTRDHSYTLRGRSNRCCRLQVSCNSRWSDSKNKDKWDTRNNRSRLESTRCTNMSLQDSASRARGRNGRHHDDPHRGDRRRSYVHCQMLHHLRRLHLPPSALPAL